MWAFGFYVSGECITQLQQYKLIYNQKSIFVMYVLIKYVQTRIRFVHQWVLSFRSQSKRSSTTRAKYDRSEDYKETHHQTYNKQNKQSSQQKHKQT